MKTIRAAGPSWPLLIGNDELEDRRLPDGILVGIGSLAIIVAGFVASALPQHEPAIRYGVLIAAMLALAALWRSWNATLIVAGIGFLVFNGFLVNQLGELSWHGWSDVERIAALGAALIFGRLIGDIYRPTRPTAPPEQIDNRKSFVKEETHDA